MATSNPTIEQMQATQKQMMENMAESYSKMVHSFTPEDTPARTAAELSLEYFNRYREIMEPVTSSETPQSFVESVMDMMKKSSELNMEFSGKYMDMYKEMMSKFGVAMN